MILVDSNVWIDHLRVGDEELAMLLNSARVLMHPFVVGELACGNLRDREGILHLLKALPQAPVASEAEVLSFIEQRHLMGRGIGYVDVHLLASVALAAPGSLWTRDKRLLAVAKDLGVAYPAERE